MDTQNQPSEPQNLNAPAAVNPPQQKRNFWLTLFTVVFLISALSGLYIIFTGGGGGPAPSAQRQRFTGTTSSSRVREGVALIRIRGVISEPSGSSGFGDPAGASTIARRIRETADRNNVKAIILDINSPGGTVAAVQDIYNAINYAKNKKSKPVIALMRDVAASGGYYISAACNKIIAQPGTLTGSIGVILQTSDFTGLMSKVGVQFGAIKSGKFKDMGSSFRPMTDEEKALFQDLIGDSYDQFFEAVSAGRPGIAPDVLKGYADGRVFTGRQALKIGLIDALGGQDEALQAAGDLAKLKNPQIISVRTNSFMDWFTSSFDAETSSKSVAKQLEAVAQPKMAYLWTI